MSRTVRIGSLVVAAAVSLAVPGFSQTLPQTQAQPARTSHKTGKKAPLPLPNGPLGPLPQFPLDSLPAVPPHVSFQDGQLTIDTPNSTLGDVLRAVHSQTLADMEIPAGATDRVALHLGPGPAREVVATLLNGSRFNYVLLGAPGDPRKLIKVVLVAKAQPDAPGAPKTLGDGDQPANQAANIPPAEPPQEDMAADNADATDDNAEAADDQAAADQPVTAPDPNQVKTPQQMLQEMQQRQLQMQQGIQPGQPLPPPVPQRPQEQ